MELPKNVWEAAAQVKDIVDSKTQEIDIIAALHQAMKVPGAKIDREKFLRKELKHRYSRIMVEKAVEHNPAYAGIGREEIDKLAKHTINYETSKATALSFTTGLPGGVVGVAAISVDIVQYFVFVLRIIQELAYLYGFDDFELNEDSLENEALNEIMLFLGVMLGSESAAVVVKAIAQSSGKAVAKRLARQALMKTWYYPVIKKIAPWLGVQMNKQIFANGVGRAIPVVGGVMAGGLTFATFKPCAVRLKNTLREYVSSDPEFYKSGEYLKYQDTIILDADEIVVEAENAEKETEEVTSDYPPPAVKMLTKAAA